MQQPVKGRFSSGTATVLSQSSKRTIVGIVSLSVRSCTKCKQPDQEANCRQSMTVCIDDVINAPIRPSFLVLANCLFD